MFNSKNESIMLGQPAMANRQSDTIFSFHYSHPGILRHVSNSEDFSHGVEEVLQGRGFGSTPATVTIGTTKAAVTRWTQHSIMVIVPPIVGAQYGVSVCLAGAGGSCSNAYPTTIDNGTQIPVTFTVKHVPRTAPGDTVYLTGDVSELGNWSTTTSAAIGPMMAPHKPTWFLLVSVPACKTVSFKFIIIHADGSVQWEGGSKHQYI